MSETIRTGGCLCGAVRYEVRGEPIKTGLCHCGDCRKETGSAFLYYGDWDRDALTVTGDYRTYEGRSFCPACGARLFHIENKYAEICLGSLDEAPTSIAPTREGWIKRREFWLTAVPGTSQHLEDPSG